MAKLQGLSLNPTKISGVCGRLMCCLKYENSYYAETYKLMPKIGSKAKTPDGEGIVEDSDIIRRTVKVKIRTADDTFEIKTYKLEEVNAKEHQKDSDVGADVPDDVKSILD